jgi:hypothetical protein
MFNYDQEIFTWRTFSDRIVAAGYYFDDIDKLMTLDSNNFTSANMKNYSSGKLSFPFKSITVGEIVSDVIMSNNSLKIFLSCSRKMKYDQNMFELSFYYTFRHAKQIRYNC